MWNQTPSPAPQPPSRASWSRIRPKSTFPRNIYIDPDRDMPYAGSPGTLGACHTRHKIRNAPTKYRHRRIQQNAGSSSRISGIYPGGARREPPCQGLPSVSVPVQERTSIRLWWNVNSPDNTLQSGIFSIRDVRHRCCSVTECRITNSQVDVAVPDSQP